MQESIAAEPIDESRVQRLVLARGPNLEEAEAPPGCSLKKYPGPYGQGLRWQARLPKGAAKFEGTRSRSVNFGPSEDGLKPKLICYQYLQRWQAEQIARPHPG